MMALAIALPGWGQLWTMYVLNLAIVIRYLCKKQYCSNSSASAYAAVPIEQELHKNSQPDTRTTAVDQEKVDNDEEAVSAGCESKMLEHHKKTRQTVGENPTNVQEELPRPLNNTQFCPRYAYLDNLKTFLTALVVSFHVGCAFGGCGPNSWYLIVGFENIPIFSRIIEAFALLNQSYFMPLFFFISAYFTPSSYAKGEVLFMRSKKRRLLIPALFVFFVISPGCLLFSHYFTTGTNNLIYAAPTSGPAWFLFWLLLFNWVYSSIMSRTNTNSQENTIEVEPLPFPSTWKRIAYGTSLCGWVLGIFFFFMPASFAGMPITFGSLPADFFMFYVGIMAKKHGWLEKDLTEQLDIPHFLLLIMVIMEGTVLIVLAPYVKKPEFRLVSIVFIVVDGLFCLDMSLAVLIIFQQWLNLETKLSRILARSAYSVYLIHPVVITGVTAIFLEIYRDDITFVPEEDGSRFAPPPGKGGGDKYVMGYMVVLIVSHCIVWAVSYVLTRLPYLRDIL